MNMRARIAVLLFTSLIILTSQIPLSLAPDSSTKTVAASGTIVYHTFIVTTLAELIDVISKVVPGNIVYIRGGVYQPTSPIIFEISGTSGSPITYEAYPDEKVVFDGSLATETSLGGGWEPSLLHVVGNWNVLRNIEVRYSPGGGIRVDGADNVLDHVETHHNRGAGANTFGDNTQFLYCVAHDNSDPQAIIPGGDADGLEASEFTETGRPSTGNYFLGCLCYGNSDDGIDLYGSTDNVIEKCVCHNNGLLQGDGRGFVLGIGGANHVSKCVAYNNRGEGFSTNGAADNDVDHCTAYNNGKVGFITCLYPNKFTNNIGSFVWYDVEPAHDNNVWDLGIADAGFISTDLSSPDFLSLRSDSPCRGKASDGSDLGALQYGERISDLLGT